MLFLDGKIRRVGIVVDSHLKLLIPNPFLQHFNKGNNYVNICYLFTINLGYRPYISIVLGIFPPG